MINFETDCGCVFSYDPEDGTVEVSSTDAEGQVDTEIYNVESDSEAMDIARHLLMSLTDSGCPVAGL